jgi:hypothetical protein
MAQFPYLYQSGFEAGAVDAGGAITDTESKSSYMHYIEMIPRYGITPWRGAYSWVIDQATGTTTACLQTIAGFNVSDTNYWSIGFAFYAKDTLMATGERSTIMEGNSGTTTNEFTLDLYYTTAAGLQLLLTETAATAVGSNPVCALTENEWHWIELYGVNGSAAGTVYLNVDGNLIGGVTSLAQGAFTDLYFGLSVIAAGHNAGVYAFDDILISGVDTSAVRIGYRNRYPMNPHVSAISTVTYGEHIFVGPGTIAEASLLTANAGDILRLYDTDTGYTTGTYNLVAEANYSSGMPIISGPLKFERGCYCAITAAGSNGARGIVNIAQDPPCGYPIAACYGNKANLKYLAIHRTRLTGNR